MDIHQLRDERNLIMDRIEALVKEAQSNTDLQGELPHALHWIISTCHDQLQKTKSRDAQANPTVVG